MEKKLFEKADKSKKQTKKIVRKYFINKIIKYLALSLR
jgi:hypothetical protein